MNREEAKRNLADPLLPADRLYAIAVEFPSLSAQIARHPALYPELREWLEQIGDPDVNIALATRDAHVTSDSSTPPPPIPDPPSPSASVPPIPPPPTEAERHDIGDRGQPPVAPPGEPSAGVGGSGRKRPWLVAVAAGLVTVAVFAGFGVWWSSKDDDSSADSELGSEASIAAGKKLASRLSAGDDAINERQAVAGPDLFYYATLEEDVGQTKDGEPYINNELVVDVFVDEEDPDADGALSVAEDVAEDLDARVVGVNAYLGSYQLLLPEAVSEDAFESLASQVEERGDVVSATPNFLSELTLASDSPTGRDRDSEDGSEWAGQWGGELGADVGNWGMQALGAPAIWDALDDESVTLKPVVVGVFDDFYESRFDEKTLHKDLPPVLRMNRFVSPVEAELLKDSSSDSEPGPKKGLYNSTHGEHVAGTIAAGSLGASELSPTGVRGVAPNVELLLASPHKLWRVEDGTSKPYASNYSEKECLMFLGARAPQIINMSVSERNNVEDMGPDSYKDCGGVGFLRTACESSYATPLKEAFFADTLVVKASGNHACTQRAVDESSGGCRKVGAPDVAAPGKAGGLKARARDTELADRLLTVGAAVMPKNPESGDTDSSAGLEVLAFSNAGADVLAPGGDVLSTVNRSKSGNQVPNSYGFKTGTSMAAPHVTGLAAVVIGINPALSAPQVKRIIEATANATPLLYWNQTGDGAKPDLKHPAPLVNGPAAVQVALLSKAADGKPGVSPGFDKILSDLEGGGYRVSSAQKVPSQLLGTWCPSENLRNGADQKDCLNLAGLLEADPVAKLTTPSEDQALLPASVPSEDVRTPVDAQGRSTTRSDFRLCTSEECVPGEGAYQLTYYPPGSTWECVTSDPSQSCPDPKVAKNLMAKHDVSYPRLVQTYVATSGPEEGNLVQSEPLLLDLSVPVQDWPDFSSLPLQEDAGLPAMNLAEIAKGDYSSIVGSWEAPTGAHAEITPSTIDWYRDGELYARQKGLTYTAMKGTTDVSAGQQFEFLGDSMDYGILSLNFYYDVPGVPSAHAPEGLSAFVEAGVPLHADQKSNESVPRIMWYGQNSLGRSFVEGSFDYDVMYRVGDIPRAEDQAECLAPVEGAYPCAGGPVPTDAKLLPGFAPDHTVVSAEVASFATPSKNIRCSVEQSEVICLVGSWDASTLPGYIEEQGGAGGVTLEASGPAHYSIHSGAPIGGNRPGGMGANTAPYGTVWYFGDFVFASEETGLTFWNAKTGYGALINKSGFYPFGPR